MPLYKYFILFIVCFYLAQSHSYPGGTPLSDNNYFIHKTPGYILIFDKQYQPYFEEIQKKVHFYFNHVQKYQNRKLLEPVVLVFLSDKTQTSNALASLFPYYQNIYYPSGFSGLYEMASPFWLDTIIAHELTHIFQLSHSSFPTFLQKILKSPFSLLSTTFLNVFPNQTLPRIILEGDAVLNESMIGKGGRLYSGFARALVFSQIKKYQGQPIKFSVQLVNETITPHGGKEKYLHGGYFSLMLINQFSENALLKFFKSHHGTLTSARSSFFHSPALIRSFKSPFDELVKMYLLHYKKQASYQQSSPIEPLFQGASCYPFNRINDKIFFISTDDKVNSFIHTYNTKTKRWTQRSTALPPGKLFKIGNEYFSRASYTHNINSKIYSLFSDNAIAYDYFNSKYVLDMKGKSVLHIDAKSNITGFKLFLNNKFYTYIHSNALLDYEKNTYYFKQKGSLRTLYKNKTPLFSYHGFYGYLTDINRKGEVFFIASTPYGSSVFKYDNRKTITRVTSSDTVTWAHQINSDSLLACEVTPEGFDYKIIPTESLQETPVFYTYRFGNNKVPEPIENFKTTHPPQFEDIDTNLMKGELELDDTDYHDRTIASQLTQKKKPYKKYSFLKNIDYSSILQRVQISPFNPIYFLYQGELIFTDYLQKNTFSLKYININFFDMILSLSYTNRAYRLIWEMGYELGILLDEINQQNTFSTNTPVLDEFLYTIYTSSLSHVGFLNFTLPLFNKGYWSSSIQLQNNIIFTGASIYSLYSSMERKRIAGSIEKTDIVLGRWRGTWNLTYLRKFSLARQAHRLWNLSVFVDYFRNLNVLSKNIQKNNFKWGIHSQWSSHIGHEFYLSPYIGYFKSQNRNIHLLMQPESWHLLQPQAHQFSASSIPINLKFFSPSLFATKEAALGSLTLTKPIHSHLLTTYVISLLYTIPFINLNYIVLNDFTTKQNPISSTKVLSAHFLEWTAGLEMQLLIDYKHPFSIGVSVGKRMPIPKELLSSPYYPSINFYMKSEL